MLSLSSLKEVRLRVRRDLLRIGVGSLASRVSTSPRPGAPPGPLGPTRYANDVVYLGPDKVRLSRLIVFWDSADSYGSYPHLREALKRIPREKVAILTKTSAKTAAQMRADLDRFRQEIGADYLDIVLLHAVREADWPEQRKGAMEVLSEARENKIVRTHGLSCHSLEALKTAARSPWVHVDLARINPIGDLMDSDPDTGVSVLRQMKAAGKGVIGMKIIGEGALRDRVPEALKFAMSLDCFTIGSESRQDLAELIKRIPQASRASSS